MTPQIVETGEFAGWRIWPDDPYEQTVGPFYMRVGADGPEMAFRAERRHLNGMGAVHGGCLMSFADFALFGIAHEALAPSGYGVTIAFTSEFISGAKEGALIEARGEVLRAGGSLIFVRGLITGDGVACLNFSGTLKRLRA